VTAQYGAVNEIGCRYLAWRSNMTAIDAIDLLVEYPQIVEQAEQQQAARQQPYLPGDPFTQVKPENSEDAEKGQ